MENWKIGKLEKWKDGIRENWKDGIIYYKINIPIFQQIIFS